MENISVLIVDDEPLARSRLLQLLSARAGYEVIGVCSSGLEAVEAIREHRPDLVLLDVQMPEMSGIEVLEAVGPEQVPAVIFVSAYDRYALHAFELYALDYLLKPFDDERFDRALQRARDRIRRGQIEGLSHQLLNLLRDLNGAPPGLEAPRPAEAALPGLPEEAAPPEPPQRLDRIAVKSGGRVTLLRAQEIDWIEGAGVYVRIHVGGKKHLLRETLGSLEQKLDEAVFVRIHRSTIVNVERVKELHPHSHGEYIVVLHDGSQLKLSRSYRENLSLILGGKS